MSTFETTTASEPVQGTPEPVETATAASEPVTDGEIHIVKIDGEEHQVTLDELRKGYSRTSDYTKKTQELANERKRLAQLEALGTALDKDPINTLKALNEAYQLSPQDANEWDEMTPQDRRLAKLEQELGQQRAREARMTIENEFSALEKSYGEFDRQEVATFAYKNDLTVTDAYKVMHFEDVRSKAQKAADEQAVLEQKRGTVLPHSGGSAQRGAVTAPQGKYSSVREAYEAALKQAG